MGITVVFHIKGGFVRDHGLRYRGGEIHTLRGLEADKWCYFEATGTIKELDKTFDCLSSRLWWKTADGSFEQDLREFKDDKDIIQMESAIKKKGELEVYVEHNVNDHVTQTPICIESSQVAKGPKGKGVVDATKHDTEDEYSEYSGSDSDSCKGIYFSDSEEDRVYELFDDGFVVAGNEVQVEADLNTKNEMQSPIPSEIAGTGEQDMQHVIPSEIVEMNKLEEEYTTDELDSASESEFENDKPKFVKFSADEEMTKNFKFSAGMEFATLQQFKDAILEHSVLNGKEIRFPKSDKDRVRAVCKKKKKCDYFIFVSRVGRTTTFRVKTMCPKHTCGRAFKNKNANSRWVAKKMLDRVKCTRTVKINEVVDDIQRRYATQITGCRAWRARQIAREIVEGESSKQYSLLWSYSEELRRACRGNKCKLELDRPGPGLKPRFGRFYVCFDGCKKAIKNSCRPFIGLDGCHLKNKYGGQLLIAVGRDPNDQYLPLAFAVVESETKDTWSWFMKLLLEDIGDQRWCFISDQQKVSL